MIVVSWVGVAIASISVSVGKVAIEITVKATVTVIVDIVVVVLAILIIWVMLKLRSKLLCPPTCGSVERGGYCGCTKSVDGASGKMLCECVLSPLDVASNWV